jgi:pimeloyl-ACP methyl ester carboxylesterase
MTFYIQQYFMASPSHQYIVVLAGWLGCKAKALQKYEALYQRLLGGAAIHTRIAPPNWIVQTCMNQPQCMDEMARQLIRDVADQIESRDTTATPAASQLYFHAFSNAGCILWDRFRWGLQDESNLMAVDRQKVLNSINGVIFDSCPIAEMSLMQDALKHCTWRERAQVVRDFGCLEYKRADNLREFSETFQTTLRTDKLSIPQLYLFSRNDPLTPHEFIQDLIRHRRQLSLCTVIDAHCWDDSAHCAHLLQHPATYERVVEEFLLRTRITVHPMISKL